MQEAFKPLLSPETLCILCPALSMFSAAALLVLAPIGGVLASIGPVTDLHIVNAFAQPDGFNRSFVTAEGTIPGPLIVGNIVSLIVLDTSDSSDTKGR